MSATQNPANACPYWVGDGFWTRSNIEPEKRWAGTKWRKYEDVMLLAASDNHPLDETGGEEEHTLAEKELPIIDGAFATNVVRLHSSVGTTGHAYGTTFDSVPSANRIMTTSGDSGSMYGYGYKFGGSQPHNNMPPYLARYYWERTE